jgi:uncharacterized protein (DUF433 family)
MKMMTIIRNKEIHDLYDKLIAELNTQDQAIDKIIAEFDIGPSYIKNILRGCGVEIIVKDKGRHEDVSRSKRDVRIFDMYLENKDVSEIAGVIGITPTRVGQIIRTGLGKFVKNIVLEKTLQDVKKDVEAGKSHKEIVDIYDISTIRKIKSNLGYNVFEACVEKRNTAILKLHEEKATANEIAEKFGLTRDHVYGILHNNGKRKRPTKTEYTKRNHDIVYAFKKGKSSQDIATKYKMTVTNINIILKNHGGRSLNKK